jgi:hypothetical protein
VLLQRGKGLVASGIAAATSSRYSHVALSLGGLLFYEALGDGVYPTTLSFAAVSHGGTQRTAAALPGASAAELLRHTALARRVVTRPFDVQDALLRVTGPFLGQPYARLVLLLPAAGHPALHQLGTWLAARLDHGTLSDEHRGLFCSQFVARVFECMGLGPVAATRAAGATSPEDFRKSRRFIAVAGAVFTADPEPPTPQRARIIAGASAAAIPRSTFVETGRAVRAARRVTDRPAQGTAAP